MHKISKYSTKITIIGQKKTNRQYLNELWRHKILFLVLAWRDITVRYKQTVVGIFWVVLRPLLTLIIFSILFGRLANLPSEGVPYTIYVFAAMLPWFFFASSFTSASESLINNVQLVSKIYFPRLIMPCSAVIVNAIDFLLSFVLLLLLMPFYGVYPSLTMLAIPFFFLLCLLLSIGLGIFFAALTVKYRDFRFVVPFILQIGLYASPVGFGTVIIPESWRFIYSLNPLVGIISGFRWCVTGGQTMLLTYQVVLSVLITVFIFICSILYFRKVETTFADFI